MYYLYDFLLLCIFQCVGNMTQIDLQQAKWEQVKRLTQYSYQFKLHMSHLRPTAMCDLLFLAVGVYKKKNGSSSGQRGHEAVGLALWDVPPLTPRTRPHSLHSVWLHGPRLLHILGSLGSRTTLQRCTFLGLLFLRTESWPKNRGSISAMSICRYVHNLCFRFRTTDFAPRHCACALTRTNFAVNERALFGCHIFPRRRSSSWQSV